MDFATRVHTKSKDPYRNRYRSLTRIQTSPQPQLPQLLHCRIQRLQLFAKRKPHLPRPIPRIPIKLDPGTAATPISFTRYFTNVTSSAKPNAEISVINVIRSPRGKTPKPRRFQCRNQ